MKKHNLFFCVILCIAVVLILICIPPAEVKFQGAYASQDQDGNVTHISYEGVIHRYDKTITVGEDVYTYTLKDKVLTVTYPDGVVCTVENFGSENETGLVGEVDETRYLPFLEVLYQHLCKLYN